MTVSLAIEALLNDFRLIGQLLRYPHNTISAAKSRKLGPHFWYMSEELVGLALLDTRVSHDSKRLMLTAKEEVAPDYQPKKSDVKSEPCFSTRGLEQFCNTNSKKLF